MLGECLAPTLGLFNGLGIHILLLHFLTGFHKNIFYQLAAEVFSMKKGGRVRPPCN
jgi:hypothetical protein